MCISSRHRYSPHKRAKNHSHQIQDIKFGNILYISHKQDKTEE